MPSLFSDRDLKDIEALLTQPNMPSQIRFSHLTRMGCGSAAEIVITLRRDTQGSIEENNQFFEDVKESLGVEPQHEEKGLHVVNTTFFTGTSYFDENFVLIRRTVGGRLKNYQNIHICFPDDRDQWKGVILGMIELMTCQYNLKAVNKDLTRMINGQLVVGDFHHAASIGLALFISQQRRRQPKKHQLPVNVLLALVGVVLVAKMVGFPGVSIGQGEHENPRKPPGI